MNEEELLKEAFKLRYEFYNLFNEKEDKWHEKYKNHHLYNIVLLSFDYKFNEIGEEMPNLLKKLHHN